MWLEAKKTAVFVLLAVLACTFCWAQASKDAKFIGNKSSKVYHTPACSVLKQMSEENKVYFESEAEAKKAQYTPCKKCVVAKKTPKAKKEKVEGKEEKKEEKKEEGKEEKK